MGNQPKHNCVLMVEDDRLLSVVTAELVEEAGFPVLAAANADEALDMMERCPDIPIVFTDINMPGSMDGLKFAHYVRRRWPRVKIIVTSGHWNPGRPLPVDAIFLRKPYSFDMMKDALSRALDRPAND